MAGVLLPPWFNQYQYNIRVYDDPNDLKNPSHNTIMNITAIQIELETNTYWWIILPNDYHDSFFRIIQPAQLQTPTQITGGVGESLSLAAMRHVFQPRNIRNLSPTPSSKMADYEMDVVLNNQVVHALVESKATNDVWRNPRKTKVRDATIQLTATRQQIPAQAGFVVVTSYPAQTIFIVQVF